MRLDALIQSLFTGVHPWSGTNWLGYGLPLTWVRTETDLGTNWEPIFRAWLTQTTQNRESVTPRYNNRSHLNNSWKLLPSNLTLGYELKLTRVRTETELGIRTETNSGTNWNWLGYELKLTRVRTETDLGTNWGPIFKGLAYPNYPKLKVSNPEIQ